MFSEVENEKYEKTIFNEGGTMDIIVDIFLFIVLHLVVLCLLAILLLAIREINQILSHPKDKKERVFGITIISVLLVVVSFLSVLTADFGYKDSTIYAEAKEYEKDNRLLLSYKVQKYIIRRNTKQ